MTTSRKEPWSLERINGLLALTDRDPDTGGVRAGTRCECRDESHDTPEHKRYDLSNMAAMVFCQCRADAARLVREPVPTSPDARHYAKAIAAFGGSVPMCAACAEWHEKGGAR